MEIMKLLPAGQDYLWGGERLKKIRKNIASDTFGRNLGMFCASGWIKQDWKREVSRENISRCFKRAS